MEDFLDSNSTEIFYNKKDQGAPSYITLLVSLYLVGNSRHRVLEDPGGGHRMSILTIAVNKSGEQSKDI